MEPTGSRVVIERSRRKALGALVGAWVFVLMGWWMWDIHDLASVIGGVLTIGFFAPCGIVILFRLFERTPGLVIDAAGFTDKSGPTAAGRVAWKDVTSLRITTVSGQRFVTVDVADPERYIARLGRAAAVVARTNLSMCGSPVHISSTLLAINFDELAETLRSFYERSRKDNPDHRGVQVAKQPGFALNIGPGPDKPLGGERPRAAHFGGLVAALLVAALLGALLVPTLAAAWTRSMDPEYARLYTLMAAFGVMLVTVALEWLCKHFWAPMYFRFGILVFQRQVRLAHHRGFTAEILEREHPGFFRDHALPSHDDSFMGEIVERESRFELPRMLFNRLDEHHIAFRTGLHTSSDRGLMHAAFGGVMYGVLSQSARVVTVRGYLSWSVLAHLLFGTCVLVVLLNAGADAKPLLGFLLLVSIDLFAFRMLYGGESRRYESVAELLESAGPPERGQAFDVMIPSGEILPVAGHGYSYEGPGVLITKGDSGESSSTSILILLENMQPLGPAHSKHSDIQNLGRGRFSHWDDGDRHHLFFSTSDNSDPRTNGRRYMVAIGKGQSSN